MKKLKKIVLVFCVFLSSFLVFLIPFGAHTQGIDSRFGINAFVSGRYEQQELDKPISVMKDMGIGFSREEFVWGSIEPEKGFFKWSAYDKSTDMLSSSGISILGVLDYSAPWATEDPYRDGADKYMPNITDWQSYVGKVVDRYKSKVRYWQIWNEPNVATFFKPEPNASQYLEILKSAYEIIKKEDSSAQVVVAGTSGVDAGYLRELERLGAADYFDILAVHPYSFDFYSPPESGFLDDMKNAERLAEELGNKPIWLTEFGWPTDDKNGLNEDLQAKYLTRTYLLSYQFSDVKKLFWYDLRNDGNDKEDRENNFGLINKDYTKKESYYAYKNLISVLNGSQFISASINNENGFLNFYFIKGDSKIRVVWNVKKESTVILDDSLGNLKVLDLIGNGVIPQYKNKSISINVSDSPIFIIEDKKLKNQETEKLRN